MTAPAKVHACIRCKLPCPPQWRVCDACCEDKEHVRRRNAGARRSRAEEREAAARRVELSEHSKAIDAAITALEAAAAKLDEFAVRRARFVRNGEAGVRYLETRRLRAAADGGVA
jgi:hypothetical protein